MRSFPHQPINDPFLALLGEPEELPLEEHAPENEPDDFDEQRRGYLRLLRAVPILTELEDEDLVRLARGAKLQTHRAGESVFDEGDVSDAFFIIQQGRVDVMEQLPDGGERCLARLEKTNYFGELGLLLDQPRSAAVRCEGTTPVRLLRFDQEQFLQLIAEHVVTFRMKRVQRRLRHRRALSPDLNILDGLPVSQLQFLATESVEEQVPQDTVVFRQDSEADRFYFVLRGEVAVERDGHEIARVGQGSFFGETALLFDTGRTATVRTTEDCVLWSVSRAAFQDVVCHCLLGNHNLMPTVLSRLEGTSVSGDD